MSMILDPKGMFSMTGILQLGFLCTMDYIILFPSLLLLALLAIRNRHFMPLVSMIITDLTFQTSLIRAIMLVIREQKIACHAEITRTSVLGKL